MLKIAHGSVSTLVCNGTRHVHAGRKTWDECEVEKRLCGEYEPQTMTVNIFVDFDEQQHLSISLITSKMQRLEGYP